MRLIITGHRLSKLSSYDLEWIKSSIDDLVFKLKIEGCSLAYSGMADGVDLWFCQSCLRWELPYISCVPFDGQDSYMSDIDKELRASLLKEAKEIKNVRNSWMVENADLGIVVFDGNKGGTHNVFQQLIEHKIPFYWVNPVGQKVWNCS